MKRILVLLSSYNGSEYISEQISSILNQSYPYISLLIRDDGSTDSTQSIISQFQSSYPERIKYNFGNNVGVVRSFFSLLDEADRDFDYYAFCDQDDVWKPDKIERAILQLESLDNSPAMVCTATQITDNQLQPLRIWPKQPRKAPSFYNALVQNIAVGATITFNRRALDILSLDSVDLNHVQMHDWWAYLCVSAFGRVVFDPVPSILYRQHSNNVVGGESSLLETLRKKWKSFKRHRGKKLLFKQAQEFYRLHGNEISNDLRLQLELFMAERATLYHRLRYLRSSKLYRNSKMEQLLFQVLVLTGYI